MYVICRQKDNIMYATYMVGLHGILMGAGPYSGSCLMGGKVHILK